VRLFCKNLGRLKKLLWSKKPLTKNEKKRISKHDKICSLVLKLCYIKTTFFSSIFEDPTKQGERKM